MRVIVVFFCCLGLSLISFSQTSQIFTIYNKNGKKTNFNQLVKEASNAQIILFGEYHNNAVIHWLQLQLIKELHAKNKNLVLGAEMFETDNQLLINEYLNGLIKTSNFEKEAKIWNNYTTDYKPLVEFAKAQNLPFIATNIPRRYASLVSSKGLQYLDSLQPQAKNLIAPLPIEVSLQTPGYQDMMNMNMGHGTGFNSKNFVDAQASKDATMAYFILKNLTENGIFVHFNGDFHSKNYGGIFWYLLQSNPNLKILVISNEETDELNFLSEWENRADFLICTPTDCPKSY